MIFLLLSANKYFGMFDTENAALSYAYDYYLCNNNNIIFDVYNVPYKVQICSHVNNLDCYKTNTISYDGTFKVTNRYGIVVMSRKIDIHKVETEEKNSDNGHILRSTL